MISKRSAPKLRDVKTPLKKMGGRRKAQVRQISISMHEGRKVQAPRKMRKCVGRAGRVVRMARRSRTSQQWARSLIMYTTSTIPSPANSKKKKGEDDSQNWARDLGLYKMDTIGIMQDICTSK